MPGLLAVPLSEIKSCCVTVFLHKNDERTTVWDIASKKACFLFGANWTCLTRAWGESFPPPAPHPWLRACDKRADIWQPATACKTRIRKTTSYFIKTELRHGCSPVNSMHIFRTPLHKNNSRWLLLFWSSLLFQRYTTILKRDNDTQIIFGM